MGHKKADDTSGGELGTSDRPWGRPRLHLDPDRLHQLREEGRSLREIARTCGVSKDTVRSALRNPVEKVSKKSQDVISPRKAPAPLGPGGNGQQRAARSKNVVRFLLHLRTLGRPLRVLHVQFHPEDEPYAKVLRRGVWYDTGFQKVKTNEPGEA